MLWLDPPPVHPETYQRIYQVIGGHPLITETLIRRGIDQIENAQTFLDAALYQPASAYDLPNMAKAVERVKKAVQTGQTILIWGDFDVDGQTATTLLVTALRAVGGEVKYHIPNRHSEGHGIKLERLKSLLGEGKIDLIITCDTGIAEYEAIDHAQAQGIDVIVTDHHKLPEKLPNAFACVNPQMLPSDHPLATLPGVGCAYKLIEALYEGQDTGRFLDLVALGIVADVAVQRGDTRYLLQKGLVILRDVRRLGLQAMIEIGKLDPTRIDEEMIGFEIAPRLNALGRLSDARQAVEFLATDQLEQARILAQRLEGFNNERKLLTEQVFQGAEEQIRQDPNLLNYAALVLAHPAWVGGVIGIVANRLVEKYQRPVVLIATPEGEIGRGSARSVAGVDITAAITAHRDLLEGYGGHTMAAGISILPERIGLFRRELANTVRAMRQTEIGVTKTDATLQIDAYLTLDEIQPALLHDLARLAPFGTGNPALLFATKNARIAQVRTIGRTGEHLRLVIENEQGTRQDVLWWRAGIDEPSQLENRRVDVAFTLRESQYKGQREIRLQYVDMRAAENAESAPNAVEWIDLRSHADPKNVIASLKHPCVWNEAVAIEPIKSQQRTQLYQADDLVIWSAPPDIKTLKTVIEQVKPQRIYVIGVANPNDEIKQFLTQLIGITKYALNQREGRIDVLQAAATLGQRENTIHVGLEQLQARQIIRILHKTIDTIVIEKTDGPQRQAETEKLETLLNETRAFRNYFIKAPLDFMR